MLVPRPMRSLNRTTLLATCLLNAFGLLAFGCGADAKNQPDPFYGVIDASALDAKLLPSTDKKVCPKGPCYPGQQGFAHGKPFYFYNLGALVTSTLPPLTASLAAPVFTLAQCAAGPAFDPQADAYPRDAQFPLFSALPLASPQPNVTVWPLVRQTPVLGASATVCNDLKDAGSIKREGTANPGRLGAFADAPAGVFLWAVVDQAGATLSPGSPSLKVAVTPGWFRGLLLGYLDGGKVPLDSAQGLVTMDGVILNPSTPGVFAKPTDSKVVLLPFVPGEAGYSPIVRLHGFTLPAGESPGRYTGICTTGVGCAATDVDFTLASKSAFNTLLIAASAP